MNNFDLKKFLAENKLTENSKLIKEWGTKVKSEEEFLKALQKELGSAGPTLFKILGSGCPVSDRLEKHLKANIKVYDPLLKDLAHSLFYFLSQEYNEIEVYESLGDVRIRFADGKKPGNNNCTFAVEVSRPIMEEDELGIPKKSTAAVNNIDRDLEDRGSDFKNITSTEKLVDLLDKIVRKLDPKFVENPLFKTGVKAFYNKYYL
jgi:hypothetical protein